MDNAHNFCKEDIVGEIIITSSESIEIALWPQKNICVGDFVLIERTGYYNLGIVCTITQQTINPARQIIPLQLTQQEISQHYPNLTAQFIKKAKIYCIGESPSLQPVQLKSIVSTIPELHSFAKVISLDSLLKKYVNWMQLFSHISRSLQIDQNIKNIILKTIIVHLIEQKSLTTNDLDKIYLEVQSMFGKNLSLMAHFFNNLNISNE